MTARRAAGGKTVLFGLWTEQDESFLYEVKDKKRNKGIVPKSVEDIGKKLGCEGNLYCEFWDSVIDAKKDQRFTWC